MSHLEFAADLAAALPRSGDDRPVYATTPHGTYLFVVEGVELVEQEGEDIALLRLREVDQ